VMQPQQSGVHRHEGQPEQPARRAEHRVQDAGAAAADVPAGRLGEGQPVDRVPLQLPEGQAGHARHRAGVAVRGARAEKPLAAAAHQEDRGVRLRRGGPETNDSLTL
jgi:hypothetical protein